MDLQNLLSYILPSWVEEHFEVVSVSKVSDKLEISLDERNVPPPGDGKDRFESKGFLPVVYLEDFPLRGKAVILKVRRRKWKNLTTGRSVTREWKLFSKQKRNGQAHKNKGQNCSLSFILTSNMLITYPYPSGISIKMPEADNMPDNYSFDGKKV